MAIDWLYIAQNLKYLKSNPRRNQRNAASASARSVSYRRMAADSWKLPAATGHGAWSPSDLHHVKLVLFGSQMSQYCSGSYIDYIQPKLSLSQLVACAMSLQKSHPSTSALHILHRNKMSKDEVQHVAYGVPLLDRAAVAISWILVACFNPSSNCASQLGLFCQTWLDRVTIERTNPEQLFN